MKMEQFLRDNGDFFLAVHQEKIRSKNFTENQQVLLVELRSQIEQAISTAPDPSEEFLDSLLLSGHFTKYIYKHYKNLCAIIHILKKEEVALNKRALEQTALKELLQICDITDEKIAELEQDDQKREYIKQSLQNKLQELYGKYCAEVIRKVLHDDFQTSTTTHETPKSLEEDKFGALWPFYLAYQEAKIQTKELNDELEKTAVSQAYEALQETQFQQACYAMDNLIPNVIRNQYLYNTLPEHTKIILANRPVWKTIFHEADCSDGTTLKSVQKPICDYLSAVIETGKTLQESLTTKPEIRPSRRERIAAFWGSLLFGVFFKKQQAKVKRFKELEACYISLAPYSDALQKSSYYRNFAQDNKEENVATKNLKTALELNRNTKNENEKEQSLQGALTLKANDLLQAMQIAQAPDYSEIQQLAAQLILTISPAEATIQAVPLPDTDNETSKFSAEPAYAPACESSNVRSMLHEFQQARGKKQTPYSQSNSFSSTGSISGSSSFNSMRDLEELESNETKDAIFMTPDLQSSIKKVFSENEGRPWIPSMSRLTR